MARIARIEHPYYPNDWLCKQQVEKIFKEKGFTLTCTVTNCRRNSITTGGNDNELYIDKVSLDSFISLIEQAASFEF